MRQITESRIARPVCGKLGGPRPDARRPRRNADHPLAMPPPRYVADLPLPPYAYVPGRFPHPTHDPGGHRFGARLPAPHAFDPARWRDCRAYLAGVAARGERLRAAPPDAPACAVFDFVLRVA